MLFSSFYSFGAVQTIYPEQVGLKTPDGKDFYVAAEMRTTYTNDVKLLNSSGWISQFERPGEAYYQLYLPASDNFISGIDSKLVVLNMLLKVKWLRAEDAAIAKTLTAIGIPLIPDPNLASSVALIEASLKTAYASGGSLWYASSSDQRYSQNVIWIREYIKAYEDRLTPLRTRIAGIKDGYPDLLRRVNELEKQLGLPFTNRDNRLTSGATIDVWAEASGKLNDKILLYSESLRVKQEQAKILDAKNEEAADIKQLESGVWSQGRWYPGSTEWNYCNSKFPLVAEKRWIAPENAKFCKCIAKGPWYWPKPQNAGGLVVRGLNDNALNIIKSLALDPTGISTSALLAKEINKSPVGKEIALSLLDPTGIYATQAVVTKVAESEFATTLAIAVLDPTGIWTTQRIVAGKTGIDSVDNVVKKFVDSAIAGGKTTAPKKDDVPPGIDPPVDADSMTASIGGNVVVWGFVGLAAIGAIFALTKKKKKSGPTT